MKIINKVLWGLWLILAIGLAFYAGRWSQGSEGTLGEEKQVEEIVKKMGESVVTVAVIRNQGVYKNFLDLWLGTPSEIRSIQADIGTGFVVDKRGLIITNRHVVAN